jgi:hypothetical protein
MWGNLAEFISGLPEKGKGNSSTGLSNKAKF